MAKEQAIKITDRVTIKGAAVAKNLTAGREYSVHPELAKRLVAKKEAEYVKAPAA
jgi:UDP-3-O-[3-hydroxymyristoyl] glucosamine N-acyltransferase